MKIKIGIFMNMIPQNGGGYQYTATILESLQNFPKDKFEILVFCESAQCARYCRKNKIKFVRVSVSNGGITLSALNPKIGYGIGKGLCHIASHFTELGKKIRQENISLFIFPDQDDAAILTVPTISVIHDLMHRYQRYFPEYRANGEYERREVMLPNMVKYSSAILTDSDLGKKHVEESYFKKLKHHAEVYALPFIAPKHIYTALIENDITVESLKSKLPSKFIFYPAQFWEHKNHKNLLHAIKLLQTEIKDIHLILVGSQKNALMKVKTYIKQHELQENVTILGFISNEALTYMYHVARAMVMPSYAGPTNIPPLEAMTAGCPVAISNIFAMPDQVGDAGLLFNPDDPTDIANCIRKLWNDDELCELLSERGKQKVSKWGEKEFTEVLYKTVMLTLNK